jgi:hypothetical protein
VNALVLVRQGYTAEHALSTITDARSQWVMCNEDFKKWLLSINEANWRGKDLIENE